MRAEIYLAKAFTSLGLLGHFYLGALPRAFLYLDHGQKELILHFWSLQEAEFKLATFLVFCFGVLEPNI